MLQANVNRFDGISQLYNRARPKPPTILGKILKQYVSQNALEVAPPLEVVVDLGCGTGNSSFFWEEHVRKLVVGIDPNEDMINFAQQTLTDFSASASSKVSFRKGCSSETGMESSSVDLVTCSQSLHWMEPTSTFQEVSRILRPGGVFAAWDCDWPPTTSSWKAEQAYKEFIRNAKAEGRQKGLYKDVHKWKKSEHLERMRKSEVFEFVKEIVLHQEECGNAKRLVELAVSQGHVATVLRSGQVTKEDLGFEKFQEVTQRMLGDEMNPWTFSYRVRIGIKKEL